MEARPQTRVEKQSAAEALAALVSTAGYPYLKALAWQLVELMQGPSLPITEIEKARFEQGALMRKSYQMLFESVETNARNAIPRGSSMMERILTDKLNNQHKVERETEVL